MIVVVAVVCDIHNAVYLYPIILDVYFLPTWNLAVT